MAVIVRVHAELSGGHHGDEHVVKSLGFQLHVKLVDTHVGFHSDTVHKRNADMNTCELHLKELAESLNDVGLLLRHDEECGTQQNNE